MGDDENTTTLLNKTKKLIQDGKVKEEEISALASAILTKFPDLITGLSCENVLSGTYAYVVPFYDVEVSNENDLKTDVWKVVKIGMSKNSLTKRLTDQSRGYANKKAWVIPKIPGYDPNEEKIKLGKLKKTYITSKSLENYVRENDKLYVDMVYIAPGQIADEDKVRERFGIPIGMWKVEKNCLENFFEGDFDRMGVVHSDGVIKASGGWKIWMTVREDGQGKTDYDPGPSEYCLMKEKDIKDLKTRFMNQQSLYSMRKDSATEYTKQYPKIKQCRISRYKNDKRPLVLEPLE